MQAEFAIAWKRPQADDKLHMLCTIAVVDSYSLPYLSAFYRSNSRKSFTCENVFFVKVGVFKRLFLIVMVGVLFGVIYVVLLWTV